MLSYGLAGAQHQEAVLRLPSERWQESDTLSVEYPHIVSDENKWGYVCTRNANTIVSINQYKFYNLSYMGDLSLSLHMLHGMQIEMITLDPNTIIELQSRRMT